jgi:hypothetical protein
MSQLINQELAIVVAVKVQNPTFLNEDFLKQTGIVPIEWTLVREPIFTDRVAQIMFENGLSIIAQPDRLMFLEMFGNKAIEAISAGTVAQKYLATLKMADYQGIGINFRSYLPQFSDTAAADYLDRQLLTAGAWQHYGTAKARTSLDLVYDLADRQLSLNIAPGTIQFPEPLPHPAVVFSATFNYNLEINSDDRVAKIDRIISNWQQELAQFNSFIIDRFQTELSDRQVNADTSIDGIKIVDAPELPPVILGSYN